MHYRSNKNVKTMKATNSLGCGGAGIFLNNFGITGMSVTLLTSEKSEQTTIVVSLVNGSGAIGLSVVSAAIENKLKSGMLLIEGRSS